MQPAVDTPDLTAPTCGIMLDLAKKKQGIVMTRSSQRNAGHASRKITEIYSQLAIGDAHLTYDGVHCRASRSSHTAGLLALVATNLHRGPGIRRKRLTR